MSESAVARVTKRDPTIDGLKLVAAGMIVMVHVSMQPADTALPRFFEQFSYTALYFFFLVAGYFHGRVGTRGATWLRQRFVRLAVPYFVWSFVFVAWWNLFHLIRHWGPYFPDPVRFVFFAGAAEVLWSLPWLFACAVAAELFARTDASRRAALVVFAAITVLMWAFWPHAWIPNYAIRQFINGGRWILVYLAGMELRAVERVKGSPVAWTAAAVALAGASGLVAARIGAQPSAFVWQIPFFLMNGGAAFSMLAGARAGSHFFGANRLAWGGDYLLGVYASHGLWLAILIRIISASSMPAWAWLPFGWIVCFGMALLVTRLLLSSRWTRLAVT